jgi:hypothetical protein
MMAVSHAEDSNGSSRMVGKGMMRCSWDVVITSDYHEHHVNYYGLDWIGTLGGDEAERSSNCLVTE